MSFRTSLCAGSFFYYNYFNELAFEESWGLVGVFGPVFA